jgi:ubiquinone/menaquinone biosynthesis C-methylase UbiE
MNRIMLALAAVFGVFAAASTLFAVVWLRERRARAVFPASQASALLNPLRRLIQDPAALIEDCGIRAGERVLELGPGPGYFTRQAAVAAGVRGSIVCADLQVAMIDHLRSHLPSEAAVNVRLVAADAMRLPFADASFDRAFLVSMLGEVPDRARGIAELQRVLRPSGVVAFCETINDPDYMREGDLRRLCWDAGLAFVARRRKPLGYIATFVRA